MKIFVVFGILLAGLFAVDSYVARVDETRTFAEGDAADKTVVDVVQGLGLSTLAMLVERAGLVSTLKGKGPFTVFGPTDDAFLQLPLNVRQALLLNNTLLTDVLTYHVVGSSVFSKDISQGKLVPSLYAKTNIRFNTYPIGDTTMVVTATGAPINLKQVDQNATNGVVHVLERVMFPVPENDLVTVAKAVPELSDLVDALVKTKLDKALTGDGPFTVFAPTNAAFSKVPKNLTVDDLTGILKYHVVDTNLPTVYSAGLQNNQKVLTLNTTDITVKIDGGHVELVDSTKVPGRVIMPDVSVTNGVVHVIDKVLIPPKPSN